MKTTKIKNTEYYVALAKRIERTLRPNNIERAYEAEKLLSKKVPFKFRATPEEKEARKAIVSLDDAIQAMAAPMRAAHLESIFGYLSCDE